MQDALDIIVYHAVRMDVRERVSDRVQDVRNVEDTEGVEPPPSSDPAQRKNHRFLRTPQQLIGAKPRQDADHRLLMSCCKGEHVMTIL